MPLQKVTLFLVVRETSTQNGPIAEDRVWRRSLANCLQVERICLSRWTHLGTNLDFGIWNNESSLASQLANPPERMTLLSLELG